MRLPSNLRLKESRDFAQIKAGGVSQAGRFLVLAVLKDTDIPAFRFGLITGKKLGNAVARNRIRRRLREIIRAHRSEIQPGFKFVTIARWRAPQAELKELEGDWLRLAQRLGLVLKATPSRP